MKSKVLQPRLLYLARLSFKMEGKIKNFPDKKAERVHLYQTSTARDAKGTALRRLRKRERRTQLQREKMAMNNFLSLIILNVNGLNVPIKDIGYLNG